MDFVNIVNENGKEEPMIMFKPYIYATVIDCSKHCVVFSNGKAKTIKKNLGGKK